MLKPEIKQLWINALLSGDYRQAEGKLNKIDPATGEHSYCCLGVLCELAIENGVKLLKEEGEGVVKYGDPDSQEDGEEADFYSSEGMLSGWPPLVVSKWAGESFGDYRVSRNATTAASNVADEVGLGSISLATLNDNGLSFEEIAEVIKVAL